MTRAIYYPKANRVIQWYGSGNSTMSGITKVLLHTTETAGGWPGYGGGGSAPTLTYEPWQHRWRQHFPLNGSARALRDPSGTVVRENRDNIVQVEIACYCDPGLYNRYGHAVTDLDDRAYQDLGDFLRFMHEEWGVPLTRRNLEFPPYPQSLSSQYRMSGPEFDAYTGVLGHMHASGNTHGDPGNLDVDRIIRIARGGEPQEEEDEFMALFKDKGDFVGTVQDAVANLRVQIQPEVDRWLWGSKATKPVNRRLVWVVNRLMNALVTVNGRTVRQGQAIGALAKLVTDRTLTDAQRETLVQEIADAAREGAATGAAQVSAEDVAENLVVKTKGATKQ